MASNGMFKKIKRFTCLSRKDEIGLGGMREPPLKLVNPEFIKITDANPTINITNVNGLKYFFRFPVTYSLATIPGLNASCQISEKIPLSAWVNA